MLLHVHVHNILARVHVCTVLGACGQCLHIACHFLVSTCIHVNLHVHVYVHVYVYTCNW